MKVKPILVVLLAVLFAAMMFGWGGSLPYAMIVAYPTQALGLIAIIAVLISVLSNIKWPSLNLRVQIGGESRSLVSAFLASIGVASLCYLILSGIFGSTLQPLDSWQEIKDLLTDPANIRAEVIKVVLVIGASWCIFLIWFKIKHETLWLFKLALGVCLFFLIFPKFNPVNAFKQGWVSAKEATEELVPSTSDAISSVVQEVMQDLVNAKATLEAWNIKKEADRIWSQVGINDIIVIPENKELQMYEVSVGQRDAETLKVKKVGEDGNPTDIVCWLINAEQPDAGSEWIAQRNILFWDDHAAMNFMQFVNRHDPSMVRAMRIDYLADAEKAQQKSASPSTSVIEPMLVSSTLELSATPDSSRWVGPSKFATTEDVVTVTGDAWIKTEIYPEDGDVIDVRAFDGSLLPAVDLEKIQIRSGNANLGELRPNFPHDHNQGYGLTQIYGDNPLVLSEDGSLTKACIRLKLSEPGQLQVRVTNVHQ